MIIGIIHNEEERYRVYAEPSLIKTENPYFHICNAEKYREADKVILLGIRRFEIINNSKRVDFWNISHETAVLIDDFMSQKSGRNGKYTNWLILIFEWNYESDLIDMPPDEYETAIDAFFDGYYDTPEKLVNPQYLSSKTPQLLYSEYIRDIV